MKHYNKLVRDKIPSIIKSSGGVAHTKILDNDSDYLEALKRKLLEEAKEVQQTPMPEELADVIEVVRALAKHLGTSMQEIEKLRVKKNHTNGSFDKRILLESTD
jgi:predicted house-cleaning noncanonical NTP pyrophosphatase (MazG superfamily)